MKAQGQFSPANPGENEVYAFDFVNDLQTGESASGITAWSIAVVTGVDADPNSHLSGAPVIDGTKTEQRITGLLSGVVYVVAATLQTTFGNTLELWAFLPCYPLGVPGRN